MKIGVIGAGWAGLAAAVRACQAGHDVAVFEAAGMPGGRARSDDAGDAALDNGQHILLGGYARTLALMRDIGVDVDGALLRLPLSMRYPDGSGFALSPHGLRLIAAMRALGGARGFSLRDKLSAVAMTLRWQARRFRCAETLTVAALVAEATPRVRTKLIEPLCVAALNTPMADASAAVFLAVMRDSLFRGREASDLLLPRRTLAQLLPLPAVAWLERHGARVHLRRRVSAVERDGDGWAVTAPGSSRELPDAADKSPTERLVFDRVILATPATEAARLVRGIAPGWAEAADALAHEPIVTLVLHAPPRAWPTAMLALDSDASRRPAQFAFKLEPQDAAFDRVTLVVSAAGEWLARGRDAVVAAAVAQYRAEFQVGADEAVTCTSVRADRRATFRCIAGVVRPPIAIAPGLLAAGDFVSGPYPATLEAAVMAGEAAAAAAL